MALRQDSHLVLVEVCPTIASRIAYTATEFTLSHADKIGNIRAPACIWTTRLIKFYQIRFWASQSSPDEFAQFRSILYTASLGMLVVRDYGVHTAFKIKITTLL